MYRSKRVVNTIYKLILIFSSFTLAQTDFTSETISIKDGLSSNMIRDIIQDQYGYIWITTAEGLNIYDGYNIKTFKNNPEDSTSLPSNVTYRILEDKHGTIWVTTDEGLARYNSVAVFVNNGGTIIESSSGDLYCTSQSFGLLKFDYKAKLFVQVPLKNDGNNKIILKRYYSIAADSHNNLWLGNSNGLWKVNLNNSEIYDVTPFKKLKH